MLKETNNYIFCVFYHFIRIRIKIDPKANKEVARVNLELLLVLHHLPERREVKHQQEIVGHLHLCKRNPRCLRQGIQSWMQSIITRCIYR